MTTKPQAKPIDIMDQVNWTRQIVIECEQFAASSGKEKSEIYALGAYRGIRRIIETLKLHGHLITK